MKYTYTAVFTERDGKVYARVPDLVGCITTGKDFADAQEQMKDALSAWLCVAEDEGLPISEPTPREKIERDEGELLSMLTVDTARYRIETDTRMVGKRVAIPYGLADTAGGKNSV
ncbi:MAG: type II toxin-antitoxin system HicB family antitoxin [Treponema sp.]